MCGICGKILWDHDAVVEESLIRRMGDVLAHRGPDETGYYIRGPLGLGHKRLSIIDLKTGRQPMSNDREDIWIVFNGEIYNFRKLRQDLEQRGYAFTTSSDTEVLLNMYEEYGTACVRHLRGMFAFAVWDARCRRLFLARDRVGQKPLFYRADRTSFSFASEIKALLQDDDYVPEINLEAFSDYLTYQYVPPPNTIFRHIEKLPPASMLVCEGRHIKQERYWNLAYQPKTTLKTTEMIEQATQLLQEAVQLRMISDVPLGAFLSGGIDSGLIVAMMAQRSSQPVNTFSIGFEDVLFNELPYSRLVAERYHTNHHEFIVKPDALKILPQLIRHVDEPFGDSSVLPTYYVAQLTARHVKVALNGDGGDESFAGYRRYLGYKYLHAYRLLPERVRQSLIPFLLNTFPEFLERRGGMQRLVKWLRFITPLSCKSDVELYFRSMSIFEHSLKHRLLTPGVLQQLASHHSYTSLFHYFEADNAAERLDKMLYTDVMTYLPGDLLVKVDRMTMAHSLEGRSPFLDHVLMEFAATIPSTLKKNGYHLKYVLKKLAQSWLPQDIIQRPKQGFSVPVGRWFRHELHDLLHDTLLSSRLVQDGYFNEGAVKHLVQEHQNKQANHHHRLWMLVNLEMWYRMYMKKENL